MYAIPCSLAPTNSTLIALVLVASGLPACDSRPASWDTVLLQRITQERPDCIASTPAPGDIALRCGASAEQHVVVAPIAQFCQRGPRDCEYAIDEVIKALPAPAR